MNAQSANHLLDNLEKQVENHLQRAIVVLQNLSEAELNRPATNGGWSVTQCLWHLNSYGDYYLPAIKRGLIAAPKSNNGFFKSGWLGGFFTKLMMPKENATKFKAAPQHTPPLQLPAAEIVAEFIRQQEELIQLLRKSRNLDIENTRVPISISQWVRLKMGDVFQFLIAHNERHLQQAQRNISPRLWQLLEEQKGLSVQL